MPQDELSSANETESQVTDTIEESAEATDAAAAPPSETPDAAPEEAINDADLDAAKAAWEGQTDPGQTDPDAAGVSDEDLQRASELAEPFVGQWNQLISTTNWEKGRIISQWRNELIQSGVDATQYSDDAWSRRVGGVTAPHVGRLRRVYERFHDSYQSYQGLYWSHFLAALDWEDAAMWLEGAANEKWSISVMREKRWQAEGAVDSKRPTESQIVEVDTDEDVTLPAQGDGKSREYDNDSGGVESGPTYEGPDFGDEEELQTLAGQNQDGEAGIRPDENEKETEAPAAPVQPFIGLPSLPNDLNEAVESLKLAILRHKAAEWRDVEVDVVERYVQAVGVLIRS
ncbi:hypothetical protein Mal15_39520 [Stieleria maiorica]|uniref:Uncharacterized protein n=1 Tax=Stieleria maiorica TaxID=2795974 RepID=A0A5B9MJU2_9BACT|nr:hypothetical protein [Stieleria maiorica]QEF99885.1 hypothetical protein Mal15_39520 [Stieleria maiorica]